jgi:dihydrofolate reductase
VTIESDEKKVTDGVAAPRTARHGSLITAHQSRVSIIVAMASNRVIGAAGRIPWRLPNELEIFKERTMGHHIVMGRKTFEAIGRLLPGRTTVIVTRQPEFRAPGAIVAHSLRAAIDACGDDDEIFVIGGAELYRAALPLTSRIYLTTVEAQPEGDTFMPELAPAEWREISAETFRADDRHPYDYRFTILQRRPH